MIVILNFKVGDHVRISKHKNIFAKGYTPNWSEEVFVIKETKNTVPWTYVINDLNNEEIIETFYEKELQKIDQQEFRIEKVIKKKGDKLYVKWKGYDNPFNSSIDKKDFVNEYIKMSPKPDETFGGDINVKVDLFNYATKTDLKNILKVDISDFTLKSYLAFLKTQTIEIKINLTKLSNCVKNDVVKKAVYDKLAAKVDVIFSYLSNLNDKLTKLSKLLD